MISCPDPPSSTERLIYLGAGCNSQVEFNHQPALTEGNPLAQAHVPLLGQSKFMADRFQGFSWLA